MQFGITWIGALLAGKEIISGKILGPSQGTIGQINPTDLHVDWYI